MFCAQSLLDLADIFPHVLFSDFMRYALGAGGVFLVVNVLLARYLAGRKIRADTAPARQMGREILASLRTVLIFAGIGSCIGLGVQAGIIPVYMEIGENGRWYVAATAVLLILLHDAWFYWTHRLIHHPRLFRRVHRLHHTSFNPTPFTSYSFNAAEAFVNALYFPLALLFIPAHPIALLIFTVHMILRNAIGHCGFELFPADRTGKPLFGWLTTVTHHDLHHAHAGYNFGLYFSWWDRWMGTEHPDYAVEFSKSAWQLRPQPLK